MGLELRRSIEAGDGDLVVTAAVKVMKSPRKSMSEVKRRGPSLEPRRAAGSAGAQERTAGQEVAQGVFLILGFMVKEKCSWRNNSLQSA